MFDRAKRDLSEVQPTVVDTVLGSVPQASPVPVRNRLGALDEDTVRPSRRLALAPMIRSGTGEQAGPDQFDMTLEDTDVELHQGEDGQATAERAPPGILDQGRVAVFVEEFGRRVPSQLGDVASPVDDPNDDDNMSDTVSVDSVEGPEEVAPDTPGEPELVAGLPRNVTLRMALVTLDEVDPSVVFRQRAAVMKSVPHFLRGSQERVEIGVGRSFLGQLSRR